MSSFEHTLPFDIKMAGPSATIGYERVVVDSVSDLGGESEPITWESYNRMTYKFAPGLYGASLAVRVGRLEEWEGLMRNTQMGTKPWWVPEALARTHHELQCGPAGDAARTTFPISCMSPTVLAVFSGIAGAGIPQDPTDYTVHAASNLLSDDQFNAVDGIADSTIDGGTGVLTRDTGVALFGCQSFKITPTGAQANIGVRGSAGNLSPVTAGEEYTGVTHFQGVGTFNIQIRWFDDDGVTPSGTASSTGASPVVGTGVSIVSTSVTATAPVGANYAAVLGFRTTNSANVFYAGGFALCPGDYDRVHIPSRCPGLIEYGSAQSLGLKTTCTATGIRLSRCYMRKKGKHQYVISMAGIHKAAALQMVERAEGEW